MYHTIVNVKGRMDIIALSTNEAGRALLGVCQLDINAFKPGNVSYRSPGHNMTAEQFLTSAQAIIEPLCNPASGVGKKILDAVIATKNVAQCNTNLGIILLSAPLIQSALLPAGSCDLQRRLKSVLLDLNLNDAQLTFEAILLASPGGLGSSTEHDVNKPAEVNLLQAMASAKDRDRIARAYVTTFSDIFEVGLPIARAALERWQNEEWAMVEVYLSYLARFTDTHIERKFGFDVAHVVKLEAAEIEREFRFAKAPADFYDRLDKFDYSLKSVGINPGTSADFSVATFLAMYIEDILIYQTKNNANLVSMDLST